MNYANNVLGCNLMKRPDLVARAHATYVVGEAKFLTDYGGHQYAQFADALVLLQGREGDAVRVAVLDGVVWVQGNTKMYTRISNLAEDEPALSSLLLDEFLQSL